MPDGSIKYVHMVAHGSRGEDGGPMEYIGAIQDVTQRRLAEEGLHAAQAALAHANRVAALGEISATIAHEINQPLATIRTNGETGLRWLDRAEPNVAKVRDLIVRMLADAQRASEIIDRIRAMAAPRAPERKVLSLDDVIKESMVFLHHEFRSKSVAVSLDLASALPCVAADGTQLQQVVVNLAINAVQAMMEAETRPRRISIRTGFSEDNMVSCTVEDSGPGIDPAHLPRLFDGFFTTRDRGMGLGLAISRSIIEAHEGRIRADNESTLGGARFSFALPANGRPLVERKLTNP
jgi:C4-dicarboxylate-specific signal transduction histidine kinase